MSRVRYTEEFKIEAVKQVVNRGHRVADVESHRVLWRPFRLSQAAMV